jgi:hypothetical protein
MKIPLTLMFAIAVTLNAHADSREQIMASRYLKYQFCMERAYGQGFYTRFGLVPIVNRWGISEPTLSSLSKASNSVQKGDAKCRAANDIGPEPRPQ